MRRRMVVLYQSAQLSQSEERRAPRRSLCAGARMEEGRLGRCLLSPQEDMWQYVSVHSG